MSDIPVNPMEPNGPVSTSGEGVAERFVDHELVETKTSLARTRIICVVLVLFVVCYVGYLTAGFHANLEPNGAAEVATGLASQRLDDLEPKFTEYIHEQVPEMIRKAPDEVISRLPEYRKQLETRVDQTVRQQAEQGATQLNKQLDDFLTAHKDEVGQLLKNGQDPAKVEQLGEELDKSLTEFLTTTKVGDTTIQEKLDNTLVTLKQVSARTAKLAGNTGLTPSEKQARHAIAMLMRRINAAQAAEPNAIKPIDVEGIKNQANQAVEGIKSSVQSNMPTMPTTGGTAPASASSSATSAAPATAPVRTMAAPPAKPATAPVAKPSKS